MADNDPAPSTHTPGDDVPRGGPWVRYTLISFVLVLVIAIAPQSWKIPLAALAILTLLVGVGKLMVGRRETTERREQ